jgi:hypothetical protein
MEMMQKRIDRQLKTGPGGQRKDTVKEIAMIVFVWLIALSLVYICYLKFKFFLHD